VASKSEAIFQDDVAVAINLLSFSVFGRTIAVARAKIFT